MPKKRNSVHKKKAGKPLKKPIAYVFAVMLLIASLFVLVIMVKPSLWQAGDRFVVLRENGDNSASFMVYEPQNQSVYEIRIPPSTQMDSANNLGKWRLGSLWQLYKDEDLGKSTIVDTFTISMGLSADVWTGDLFLKDRIKIFVFEFRAGKSQYIEVDPIQFGLVSEVRLVDGDQGYVAGDKVPGLIARLFASEIVLKERARVGVKNYSSHTNEIENINRAVEILGTKIVSVENLEERNFDCEIKYKPKGEFTAKKLANIYSCDLQKSDDLGSLDISMDLGNGFWKRY